MADSEVPSTGQTREPTRVARGAWAVRPAARGWLARVVALEWAAVVFAVAWPWGTAPRILGAMAAVSIVVSAVGRFRGRWCASWYDVLARFWLRRGAQANTQPLQVESFQDRAGNSFGMINEGGCLTAVLAVEPVRPDLVDHPDALAALDVLSLLTFAGGRDVQPAQLRVVSHVVAAPTAMVDRRSLCSVSYREVAADYPVGQRSVWLCLRLDPGLCPEAITARGGGPEGARRALGTLAARLVAAVAHPLRLRPLGADEIRTLAASLPGLSDEVDERLDRVSDQGVSAGYRVESWGQADLAALTGELMQTGVIDVRAALSIRPTSEQHWSARPLVVLHAREDEWARVQAESETRLHALGVRLRRLDGEHRLAVAETLPSTGAAWPSLTAAEGAIDVDTSSSARLRVASHRGGLHVGQVAGRPTQLSLFRDRPTSVVTAMDPRVTAVVCFRALALGARVVVVAERDHEPWVSLKRLTADRPGAVQLIGLADWPSALESATALCPTLVVIDRGPNASRPQVAPAAWQCVLEVLPDASLRSFSAAADANVTLVQRLDPGDSVSLAPLLGVDSDAARVLTGLAEDEIGVVENGRVTLLRWQLSGVEAQLVAEATARAGLGVPAASAAGAAKA